MASSPLNLSFFGLVGVIMLVLAGTSFVYLLRVKEKFSSSRMLLWFFLFVMLSAIATILTNSGTAWEWAFASAQDALLLLGGIFLLRFAYLFPENDQPAEARPVVLIYTAIALAALGYAAYFALAYFANLPADLAENKAFYLLTPAAVTVIVLIFFRRAVHCSAQPAVRSGPRRSISAPLLALRNPENPPARALRNYGLALAMSLIPVVVTVIKPVFPAMIASFLFNFGIVAAIAAVMLVYLNHAPEPTSIYARLVGVSLVTTSFILGLASVLFFMIIPVEDVHTSVVIFIFLVLLSSVLILLLIPLFFRTSLLDPLSRLSKGVKAANAGNLDIQVPVQYEDEIGFLTHSFNQMVSSLHDANQALKNEALLLEKQVGERTAELHQSNEQLLIEIQERKETLALLDRQLRYEQALSLCAATLSGQAESIEQERELLSRAMDILRDAAGTKHARVFENLFDPAAGLCARLVAESVDPGTGRFPHNSQAEKMPWSLVPLENRLALENGEAIGGPITRVFSSFPGSLAELQQDGIRAAQFFPIHLEGRWWGYISFGDTRQVHDWDALEIGQMEMAAGIVASFLLRTEKERSLVQQNTYQQALSRCSRELLRPAATEQERAGLLNEALSHLMEAVGASRAYIFQNRLDPLDGETMGMRAESVAPGVRANMPNPANQNFPWALLPAEMYTTLRDGRPFGAPVEASFASTPELRDIFLNQEPPLLSVQFFPIHLYETWWGFIGFDDCMHPRVWQEAEIRLLGTGAEMISSVLQRWEREDAHRAQALAQETLAHSSQRLLQPAASDAERRKGLTEALEYLVTAASASRGYLYENFEHPQEGFSLKMVCEACAPEVQAHRGGPLALHVPWSLLPAATREALEQGEPAGGPVEVVLAGSPEIQDALESDPALSVLFFPIHFTERWWGIIGFDDLESLRDWNALEIMLLRTGAEIFSQTLQRWEAEDQLRNTLNALEERVQQRTRQLSLANARLLEEIEERRVAQQHLKNQLAIETVLAGISTDLMVATDLDAALGQSLAGLGELFHARRVSLILLADRQDFVITDVYSWQAPGVLAFNKEDAQYLSTMFRWSTSQLARHKPVYFQADHELPVEAQAENAYLRERGLNSLLLVPLVVQNLLTGVLACENTQVPGENFADARRMLEVAASILSNALAHNQLLDDLERKINTRTQELAALYDLAILGSQSARLGDVLLPMLSRILEIGSSDATCLYLVDDHELRLMVHLGLPASQLAQKEVLAFSPQLQNWLSRADAHTGHSKEEAVTQPDIFAIPDFAQMHLVRLRTRNHNHGVLGCYRRENLPYSPHVSSTLAAIGEQLGVIIENHHLRMEAEALVRLRERQRLARELHDSVSQSLYSLTLFARGGRDALETSDLEKLARSLEEVEVNAQHALREMRLLLYQLRSEAVEQGLSRALTHRFEMIEHRLGIRTELAVDEGIPMNQATEQELFWLISEALNNVVKHASAGQVAVTIKNTAAGLEISVVDDGVGFDVPHARAGIGLDSMRERAELLDGRLELHSQPGSGTLVRLVLPPETSLNGR